MIRAGRPILRVMLSSEDLLETLTLMLPKPPNVPSLRFGPRISLV